MRGFGFKLAASLILIPLVFSAISGAQVRGSGLEALPSFSPSSHLTGTIRMNGSELAGLTLGWEKAFQGYHPQVRFENSLLSGDAAIGALEAGATDIAVNGREPVLTEFLAFVEVFGNDGPFQVRVATGSYRVLGRTWAQVIWVNKDNPLREISMDEIDRVFGSARLGTYDGYKWRSAYARGAETNIRSWGQLGLKGEWASHRIQTYGYAPTGMSNFFELTVFHGGTKWNENLKQFIETGAKQATDHEGTIDEMMDELSKDRYGMAWAGVEHGANKPGVRMLAVRPRAGEPAIACTLATVADRSYPLTRSVFLQINRPPGTAIQPLVQEFLRFVLSREGQAVVQRQGEYLPLPAEEDRRQREALR